MTQQRCVTSISVAVIHSKGPSPSPVLGDRQYMQSFEGGFSDLSAPRFQQQLLISHHSYHAIVRLVTAMTARHASLIALCFLLVLSSCF